MGRLLYQKAVVRRRKECMSEMELVSCWKEKSPQLNREKVVTVPASHRYRLEKTTTWHPHLEAKEKKKLGKKMIDVSQVKKKNWIFIFLSF